MAKTKADNILNLKEGTMKNECGKMRKIDNPYEVWKSFDGTWEWRVLKKWQSPDKEAANPYARWFCGVRSPFTYGEFELGDCYVKDVISGARKVVLGTSSVGPKA